MIWRRDLFETVSGSPSEPSSLPYGISFCLQDDALVLCLWGVIPYSDLLPPLVLPLSFLLTFPFKPEVSGYMAL